MTQPISHGRTSAPQRLHNDLVMIGPSCARTQFVRQHVAKHKSYATLCEAYRDHNHSVRRRFFAKVDRRAQTECWPWKAADCPSGYGKFNVDGKTWQAHRVAYRLLRGPFKYHLTLDHLCSNRICVNPWHLEPVTQAENVRRGAWATKTHCVRGHLLSGNNLANWKSIQPGRRQCLPCAKINAREGHLRRKAERAASLRQHNAAQSGSVQAEQERSTT